MSIFVIVLNAVLVENFIFIKFLGICPFLGVSKRTETAFGMGMAVIFTMTMASALTYLANRYILIPMELEYLQTIAFILIIATLVQFIEMFLNKSMPALYQTLGIYLPLITTNCAVLGVAILNIQNDFNFIQSVTNGCAAGVGFTLAIVIFSGVRERIQFNRVPKAFQGFPIALIAAALISMAFMGFQGLKIPGM